MLLLGLSGARSGAEGVPLPADGTCVHFDDPSPAEPVPRLCAPTAKVVSEKTGLVANVAWLFQAVWIWSPARGHPEESVSSGLGPAGPGVHLLGVRVLWRVVWRDIWRWCSRLGALGRCAWPVCQLNRGVMYEQVILGTLVARGVLCLLCVQLDAMLQLFVRSCDGAELHGAHCGLCI